MCPLSGHDTEDILHVLRDFPMAKEALMLIVPTERRFKFFLTLFKFGFLLIFVMISCRTRVLPGLISLGSLLGDLWKNRNLLIFQNINWSAYETIKPSLSSAQHFEPFLV